MYQRVKARISKTNKFREVMLRREPQCNDSGLYGKTPAYIHASSATISGKAYETDYEKWVFVPNPDGINRNLVSNL